LGWAHAGEHNEERERHDVNPGAVQAQVVDDDEFGVEEPQYEAHRDDGDHEARDVNPIVLGPPSPRRVEHRHHDVGAQAEESHRDAQQTRLRRGRDGPAVDESLVSAEEGLWFEVGDREIGGEGQADQT